MNSEPCWPSVCAQSWLVLPMVMSLTDRPEWQPIEKISDWASESAPSSALTRSAIRLSSNAGTLSPIAGSER